MNDFPHSPSGTAWGNPMRYPQKYLRSKQERLSDSFPPPTHGGRKGSGSSAQAFISALLHNCAVPLQNSSRFQHDQTHGRRLGKRQGKGMCLALGYAANQWQRWEENLQVPQSLCRAPTRLHIPAILRTYFSKPEMLLYHRLTIQLSAPPAS